MKSQALGMIETKGLVPAIEAGDAGVKAANVNLLGYEIVQGGLVMVAFTGEVAAVQASVSAGSAAAAKVGQVISEHVIPRPEADLRMVFKGKSAKPENDAPPPDPEGKAGPGKEVEGEAVSDAKAVLTAKEEDVSRADVQSGPAASLTDEEKEEDREAESTGGQERAGDADELETMTVGELRRLARKTSGIAIHGREISRANKDQLIKAILRARGGKD